MLARATLRELASAAVERGISIEALAGERGLTLPRYQAFAAAPPLCFLHVPKSAGSSVQTVLESMFDVGEIAPARTAPGFDALGPETAHYRLVCGHIQGKQLDWLAPETQIFSIIRDPVELVVSLYHFAKRLAPDEYMRIRDAQPWRSTVHGLDEGSIDSAARAWQAANGLSLAEVIGSTEPDMRTNFLFTTLTAFGGDFKDLIELSGQGMSEEERRALRATQLRLARTVLARTRVLGRFEAIEPALFRLAAARGWPAPPLLPEVNRFGDPTRERAQDPELRRLAMQAMPEEMELCAEAMKLIEAQEATSAAVSRDALDAIFLQRCFDHLPALPSMAVGSAQAWAGTGWSFREPYNNGLYYRRIEGRRATLAAHVVATDIASELRLSIPNAPSMETLDTLSARIEGVVLPGRRVEWTPRGSVVMSWTLPQQVIEATSGRLLIEFERPAERAGDKLWIDGLAVAPASLPVNATGDAVLMLSRRPSVKPQQELPVAALNTLQSVTEDVPPDSTASKLNCGRDAGCVATPIEPNHQSSAALLAGICQQTRVEVDGGTGSPTRRTYLHLGFARTATTLLQRVVFPSLPGFAVATNESSNAGGLLTYLRSLDEADYDEQKCRSLIDELLQESSRPDRLIISDETLLEPALLLNGGALVTRSLLIARLGRLFGPARVLVTIRNQHEYMRSKFAMLKANAVRFAGVELGRYEDWLRQELAHYRSQHTINLDFEPVVASIEKVFGKSNITVAVYEDLASMSGDTFRESIASFLEIDAGSISAESFAQRVNASESGGEAEVCESLSASISARVRDGNAKLDLRYGLGLRRYAYPLPDCA